VKQGRPVSSAAVWKPRVRARQSSCGNSRKVPSVQLRRRRPVGDDLLAFAVYCRVRALPLGVHCGVAFLCPRMPCTSLMLPLVWARVAFAETRGRSAWISRKLRLLRAHALTTKIVGTHRYQLTSSGRRITVAVLSALRSTVAQLTPVRAQRTAVAA
jgi:hypothetical protein